MKRATVAAALTLSASLFAATAAKTIFDFAADKPGGPPLGWSFGRTGQGRPGRWVVEDGKDLGATGRFLVQRDADNTDNRFPVAFSPAAPFTDGAISVRCKPLSGKVD